MSTKQALILSSVRTGSTWLGESLGQHHDITYDEELLLEASTTYSALGQIYSNQTAWNYVYSFAETAETDWHLWKLQSYQALDSRISGFLERLSQDPAIAIIFLHRENLFHWFVSIKVSEKLKVFTKRVGDEIPELEPFEINGDEIELYMEKELAWWDLVRSAFSDRPQYLETRYEVLCTDYERECARLMSGLKLNPITAQTRSLKMQTRDPRRQVTNYAELKEMFAGTKFEKHGFS